ncbi:hypothetical protein BsWGS_11720 [Bradybaena similaris]
MSCFGGQMKEYSRIAIDRFDGKNLQCTAFFLSHCHTDHMVGLNSSSFANSLHRRNGIFLYCSEITRLLLLAEKEYYHLQQFIRVLKVGVPQPVCVPSNITSVADCYVNVTLISAGHCPGSVMFLFEGHEGKCLYTGDFRWETNHAAGVAAFKEESGLKHIKSIYVDTTFCTPEAFHIPSRSECIDAAATVIDEWLQRFPLNVVFISCAARYGYEHLLMELSAKLNIKIHVPEWKTAIYDQIPELQNVFTSDPTQTRIHACSTKVSYASSLPCHRSSGSRHINVLNLRPSAMWFTSEKSTAKREDLVVPPASPKGFYRICYSMHSSYSEIRDLVSYLQPENAFPNVQPMSDASIDIVQARLHSFQKHVNSARVQVSDGKTPFQPLGTLRRIVSVHTSMQNEQNKQDAASLDELVFSSQEAQHMPSFPRAGMVEESIKLTSAACEGSPAGAALSSSPSNTDSSYRGSIVSGEGLLFSDSEEQCRNASLHMSKRGCGSHDDDCLHICLSSDSAASENTSNGECEVIPIGDYDKDVTIAHSATHEVDVGNLGSGKPGGSQSKQNVSLMRQQKPRKPSVTSSNYLCEIDLRPQHTQDSCAHEQTVTKTTRSSDVSMSVRSSSHIEVDSVMKENKSVNDCTTVNSFIDDDDDNEDSDIVFSSQGSTTTALIPNRVGTVVSENMSAIFDQREKGHEATVKNIIDNDTSSRTASSQTPETVTVLSSSEDSLSTLEPESQELWSVSYNLANFAHVKRTPPRSEDNRRLLYSDKKISLSNSVPSVHTGKDNCSLKQRREITLQTQELQQSSFCNKTNAQFTMKSNDKQLITYEALKRKSVSNKIVNKRIFKSIKKFKNNEKCDSLAGTKNKCNTIDQRANGRSYLFTRLKESASNESKVVGSERNVNIVENTHTETNCCRQDHILTSNDCHYHSAGDMSAHSIQISDLIDLTIETPTEMVDLTLEDFP